MSWRGFLREVYFRGEGKWLPSLNDRGNRDVEYSYIAAHLPVGSGYALDVGSGKSWLGLLAARRGYHVTSIDMRGVTWNFEHPRFHFVRADLLNNSYRPETYDLILNCSTIEHIGLLRYGTTNLDLQGDRKVMYLLRDATKYKGLMLLTTQVGQGALFPKSHRIYGREELRKLLLGWDVEREEYWSKASGIWKQVTADQAFLEKGTPDYSPLGLFTLRKE